MVVTQFKEGGWKNATAPDINAQIGNIMVPTSAMRSKAVGLGCSGEEAAPAAATAVDEDTATMCRFGGDKWLHIQWDSAI